MVLGSWWSKISEEVVWQSTHELEEDEYERPVQ